MPYPAARVSTAAETVRPSAAAGSKLVSARRSGIAIRPSGRSAPTDGRLDAALIAVLVIAVLLPGIVVALGLPSKAELLADLCVFLLLGWGAVLFWRSGRELTIPYLVLAFAVVLAVGAVIAGDPSRTIVAAKNLLLLPALAFVLAALGADERRNRLAILTVLGLVCVQFVVMIGQGVADVGVDLIVGTFGDFSGPSTGFALEAAACVALGLYASSGRPVWLLLAFVLPLASVWSAIRLVPFVLPVAGLAVAIGAFYALRGADRTLAMRRSLVIALTAVVATGAILGGFAIFRSSDFQLVTSSDAIKDYAEDAETASEEAREIQSDVVPGRKAQFETAIRLVDDGPVNLLFGRGLGATTYAENLGIEQPSNQDFVIVGYMDAGTLLVEVGWLGLALVAFAALAAALASIGGSRRAPPGSWTRALLVAYPGVLVAMAAGLVHGNPIRNIGSATIFWILTGLVLASVLNRGREDPHGSTRPSG